MKEYFDKNYFELGPQSGKSLYQNYRWIPELTIPLAHHIIKKLKISQKDTIVDYGCAKGYLVKALRLMKYNAFGVDISEYAISSSDKDTMPYLSCINELEKFEKCDYLVCKDILEHIPYENLQEQLSVLRECCSTIFVIVPLGENGKYYIPAYEADKSHFIRETGEWWISMLEQAGFNTIETTNNMSNFKDNWVDAHPTGNLLYIGN